MGVEEDTNEEFWQPSDELEKADELDFDDEDEELLLDDKDF